MTAMLDDEAADPDLTNTELRLRLSEALSERDEAEAQTAALAEVLEVINSSPGDLTPVFDAMLEKATRLCDAAFGFLWTWDGEQMHRLAFRGLSDEFMEEFRQPLNPPPGSIPERIITGERVVFDVDVLEGPRRSPTLARLGARSCVGVALRKEHKLLGGITMYRREVRPFAQKQLTVLESFAAQAVIAMENARLITETREALEQQTATAEVLGVINSSPGDLAQVFDNMLDKAMRLCSAEFGEFFITSEDKLRAVAERGVPAAFAEFRYRNPAPPAPGSITARILSGEPVIHVADVKDDDLYRRADRQRRALVDLGGARTFLSVTLIKDREVLGSINIYRQQVRPFSDKQIALLQNFAAQAVIAMENARLITETREALEQQTATAEVLQVINSSPGDLAPVFDAILEKAHSLCGADRGHLTIFNGEHFRAVAFHGVPDQFAEMLRQPFWPAHGIGERMLAGEPYVQIPDMAVLTPKPDDKIGQAAVEIGRMRTLLFVPLRKDKTLLGHITAHREEVRSFTDKQIALLQNFAAQAVIAMESARVLGELRERTSDLQESLEYQIATSDVLQVISRSTFNLQPVLDTLIQTAVRLCNADFGNLFRREGTGYRRASSFRLARELQDSAERGDTLGVDRGSIVGRVVLEGGVVHVHDVASDPDYTVVSAVRLGKLRSCLGVPLMREGDAIGVITLGRHRVEPFTERQIELVQTFADQAVIAMENARLITETHEALEQQTATAEVLGVINSSPGDLTPVFDAMLEKATTLCEAACGVLWTYDGQRFRSVALRGAPPEFAEFLREPVEPGPGTGIGRLVSGDPLVHITDLAAMPTYAAGDLLHRAGVELGGIRSLVVVPLRKDAGLVGAFAIYRQDVRPFTDKQIALLQNFADQAVIAMENARLITETREALEQQTATAEVLQVINASPGDLAPVFDAMLEKAMHLCGAKFGELRTYDGERFPLAAARGVPSAYLDYFSAQDGTYQPGSGPLRLLAGERLIHIPDLIATELYERGDSNRRALVELGGARAIVVVPLLKDNSVRGFIMIFRQEPGPFSDKQIALLQNFAAQAVIAIENARLVDEIRQRQAELRVTFDNMADGVVMFDEELRLTAWNRNFQELLDLPDALLMERPSYANYLHLLAERGEFGTQNIEAEVSRRLEHTDQEFRQERTRPDGRVIEVRRNAVPDGGFVLIYSDITERKRSEAEIRAARDAAEATLRDLRAAQANLIQAEKMASLGQLTAGIAHEIKNPLNFVNNFAGLSVELLDELKETAAPGLEALGDKDRADVDETIEMLTSNLEKIAEHGKRADNIVKSMLEHSRGGTGERRAVDLNSLIDEALNLAYHGGRAQDQSFNITLARDFDTEAAPIELVPQDITRVCLNLFGNGFYAATKRQKEGGDPQFKPTLKVSTRDLGDAVEIRARDNGMGIPPEIRDKLFQPFFTTKPTGEGTGLGLSISYDIVTQQHGGTIEVESRVGEFTEFTVRLPRRPTTTGAAA